MEVKASRKIGYGTTAATASLLLLLLAVAVNLIAARHWRRWDWTEGRINTLSPVTGEILDSLEDPVMIEVYRSGDLPAYFLPTANAVQEIIDEYRHAGGGRVRVRRYDPSRERGLEQRLRQLGINPVQLAFIDRDQRQLRQGYLGLAIYYRDRIETIPFAGNPRSLEYELTSALKKLILDRPPRVGFLAAEHSRPFFRVFRREISRVYELADLTVPGPADTSGIDTLLAVVDSELGREWKQEIGDFLARGGRVIWLIDAVIVDENLNARPADLDLDDFFAAYGLRVNPDLVMDYQSMGAAAFQTDRTGFTVNYPFYVRAAEPNLARDIPVFSGLDSFVLPWTSSLDILREPEGVETTVLARSSSRAFAQSRIFSLAPQLRHPLPGAELDSHLLAVIVKGLLDRYPEPGGRGRDDTTGAMVVIGNSRMARDELLQPGNLAFLLNTLDYLSLDENLIRLRARLAAERPLRTVSAATRTTLRWLNILLAPSAVIGFGLIRYWIRRSGRTGRRGR